MSKVYLVGAGCGDLELYTLKAMKCIHKADCIIYDSLVDERILEECQKDCIKIFAGKRAGVHAMEQEEINQLLVDSSKKYETVVRLKGGDVYVFGRGGEEGKYLYENGIDFEVVPGISSAIAGLAYAGIPITQRGIAKGFQVFTGTAKKNEPLYLNYTNLLDNQYTYVFLMSIGKLSEIVNGLLTAGKDPQTPIAIISQATMPSQQTMVSTLGHIVEQFNSSPLPTPGLIVVGEVVKMREYLNFFETKPLFNQKVLVARVGDDHQLRDELINYGAMVTEMKTGEIEYLEPVIPEINGNLIFTGRNGVIGFMKAYFKQYKDVRKLALANIIAIGNKTNKTLEEYGIVADWMPSHADSDYLNQEFKKEHKTYLVAGDYEPSVKEYDEKIIVYTNHEVEILNSIEHYQYAFFTNASSVRRFHAANPSVIDTFVSIGKHTSEAIQECYPEANIIEMKKPDKSKMVQMIISNKN